MPRHKLTAEDRSKGGRNQSTEDKSRAGKEGFRVTTERYGLMSRKWLKYAPGMRRYKEGKFDPHVN